MGLATARALARLGAEVVVYEQFVVGHVRGSSHGSARIVRRSYPDATWIALAQRAMSMWAELEEEYGAPLLTRTGLLDVGTDLTAHRNALTARGVEYEDVDADDARRRFGFAAPDGAELIFERDAGVVHADRAQVAFRSGAEAAGATVRERTRVERLADVEAERVVVTAGSWARSLLAEVGIDLPVTPTRETVAYFDPPATRQPPAIIDRSGPESNGHAYALPTPEGLLKVGLHRAGPATDPAEVGRFDPRVVDGAARWLARSFGGDPPAPTRVETCLYTNTADESFVLERHGRYVVGSPCSGHGFKFAPAIGEQLAQLALGSDGSSS